MRTLLSCLLIVLFMASAMAQDEESYVKLYETKGSTTGQASGPTMLQFHGRNLKDLFRELDPAYAYEIDNSDLRNTRYSLEVLGDLTDKTWIIEQMNKILAEEGHEVKKTRRHPRIYTLAFPDQSCELSEGATSRESQVNQFWKGECVTLSRIMEKLHEWHPNLLIQFSSDNKVPLVKLEKSTVKDLQKQLTVQGVDFEIDEALSLNKYITVYR